MRKALLAGGVCVLLLVGVGCGEGEGVADGASVTAYVEAPLCASAEGELRSQGGRTANLQVRAICLPSPHKAKKLNLATLGANARRTTEDSTAVAFLEASEPEAARFTHPILDSAGIAWISASSGKTAMRYLLDAIQEADAGSIRDSIREVLR